MSKNIYYYNYFVYQAISAYLVPNSSSSLAQWSYDFKDDFLDKDSLFIYEHQMGCGVQTIFDSTFKKSLFCIWNTDLVNKGDRTHKDKHFKLSYSIANVSFWYKDNFEKI